MSKRELSTTLMNLKFMQRAVQREEKVKKEEEPKPDGNLFASTTVARKKCVVITEGDPHPGAVRGRMSFQSFNPSLDKMVVDPANVNQPEAPGPSSSSSSVAQPERASLRENGSSQHSTESSDSDKHGSGDLKRKQSEVASSVVQYPNKSPKNGNGQSAASPSTSNRKSKKQHEKLDWNVLRPPKGHQQRKG